MEGRAAWGDLPVSICTMMARPRMVLANGHGGGIAKRDGERDWRDPNPDVNGRR